jgi:hypothetical protein
MTGALGKVIVVPAVKSSNVTTGLLGVSVPDRRAVISMPRGNSSVVCKMTELGVLRGTIIGPPLLLSMGDSLPLRL